MDSHDSLWDGSLGERCLKSVVELCESRFTQKVKGGSKKSDAVTLVCDQEEAAFRAAFARFPARAAIDFHAGSCPWLLFWGSQVSEPAIEDGASTI